MSTTTGPWWGLRCCCAGSDLDPCPCTLHLAPIEHAGTGWTEYIQRCELYATVAIPAFDREAMGADNLCYFRYPYDGGTLDNWPGTYVLGNDYWFTALRTYEYFDADALELRRYCATSWYRGSPSTYVDSIQLAVFDNGYVKLTVQNHSPGWTMNWGRQLFSGSPPWDFTAPGAISLPFASFLSVLLWPDAHCDFSGIADVIVQFHHRDVP